MASETARRKRSHIDTALRRDVGSHIATGFDDVFLVHMALPEIDREDVNVSTELFGHKLSAPIMIESMTGGTPIAARINAALGKIAEELRLPMGVGSQRAAIDDPRLAYTFEAARENAPSVPIWANLGCPQIIREDGIDRAKTAVEMINADGLFVHLNPVQEAVQPEGETHFRGALGRIRELVSALSVPVVVKETGAGICQEVAISIEQTGAKGIDVAGLGGTSWAAVEYYRAKQKDYSRETRLGMAFWDWGIPTAASIVEVARSTKVKVFASGGVRSGLHAAKSIALGAHFAGLALPLLKSVSKSGKVGRQELSTVIEELKTALFLVGCRSIDQLHKSPVVITGRTHEWLAARKLLP